MADFVVEIPVRIGGKDRTIKFGVEAEDENDALERVALMLLNQLEPEEEDTVDVILS